MVCKVKFGLIYDSVYLNPNLWELYTLVTKTLNRQVKIWYDFIYQKEQFTDMYNFCLEERIRSYKVR